MDARQVRQRRKLPLDCRHTADKKSQRTLDQELSGILSPMKILIACEYSGRVRDAFSKLGHDAMSCDLLPSETPGKHYQGNVLDVINDGFDLMIAHPPCTHLAVSGARWFKEKQQEQIEALDFVNTLLNAPIKQIALENPVSIISTKIRKPDQIIQPWQYGHGETKTTCLWLKNLPDLKPTDIVAGREPKIHMMPPSADRWKLRSTTYLGIAQAMAEQWSKPYQSPHGEQLELSYA
jgi:hypothetical protein